MLVHRDEAPEFQTAHMVALVVLTENMSFRSHQLSHSGKLGWEGSESGPRVQDHIVPLIPCQEAADTHPQGEGHACFYAPLGVKLLVPTEAICCDLVGWVASPGEGSARSCFPGSELSLSPLAAAAGLSGDGNPCTPQSLRESSSC